MSFKIEPFSEEFTPEEEIAEIQNKTESNEPSIKTPAVKYSFLQKPSRSCFKLKKPCSSRTCNAEKFQCRQILPEQRSLMINQFWIEMDMDERLNYIIRNTKYLSENVSESEMCLFSLTITGQCYSVCKKMFLSTLSLVEKHVKQIIIANYEKNKNSEQKHVRKNPQPKSLKVLGAEKKTLPKRSANKKSNKNIVKIEYVEVDANGEDGEESDKNESKIGLHLEEEEHEEVKTAKRKKSVPKTTKTKKSKVNKVKPKPIKRKYTKNYESMTESEEDSDVSWNKGNGSKSSISNESDTDEDELKIPPVKIERTSRRSVPIPTKKPKIEPQSDIENVNSSSDDDDFSVVEDTDTSDVEENNKIQTDIKQDNNDYSNGITIPKKIGPHCNSTLCPKLVNRSCKNIKQYQRENIFDEFWNTMSFSDRKFYVKQNVEILEQKGRSKSITPLIYNLTIGTDKLQVCQKMFHSTLALRNSCVYNWIYDRNENDKSDENDISNILDPLDTPKTLKARKRFENYTEKLQLLEDFLDSLEKMPPKTFAQQKAHKNYLTEEIEGLRNLQRLYKIAMRLEGIVNPLPVKLLKKVFCAKQYTFYTGYKKKHAKFKTIDDSEITPELEEAMKRDQQERQRDKILSKKPGSNIIILDIDTCDAKASPNWNGDGEDSESNARLCCFNLTVSNVITLHTYNYWFCEIDSLDTTPSSFITCLMDYLDNFCSNAKQILIYSRFGDSRFKNIDMTNALLDYSVTNKISITQKFYIPRKHLYKDETECQSVYRSLHRKLRRFEIHLPSDYITATIDCKREPMEAKWFHFNQFRDYSSMSKKHRYTNLANNNDDIDHIKSIISKQDGTVSVKMDFDESWTLLPNLLKCKSSALKNEWPQLSYDRRKISAIKYQLLQSLKVKLPRDCHFFYDYLTIEI